MAAVVTAPARQDRAGTVRRSEDDRPLPVLPALESLFATGGLRRGSAVAVRDSTSLLLALLAGPSRGGAWCGVVGLPGLGLVAAAEAGIALERLALVPDPGRDWAAVAAALLDAMEVVVVAPRGRVPDGDVRRLAARARQRGAVLVPYGPVPWPGADLRLGLRAGTWEGVGEGSGRLLARRVLVRAEGRGSAARVQQLSLWLPAADGEVRAAPEPTLRAVPDLSPVPGAEPPAAKPRPVVGPRPVVAAADPFAAAGAGAAPPRFGACWAVHPGGSGRGAGGSPPSPGAADQLPAGKVHRLDDYDSAPHREAESEPFPDHTAAPPGTGGARIAGTGLRPGTTHRPPDRTGGGVRVAGGGPGLGVVRPLRGHLARERPGPPDARVWSGLRPGGNPVPPGRTTAVGGVPDSPPPTAAGRPAIPAELLARLRPASSLPRPPKPVS